MPADERHSWALAGHQSLLSNGALHLARLRDRYILAVVVPAKKRYSWALDINQTLQQCLSNNEYQVCRRASFFLLPRQRAVISLHTPPTADYTLPPFSPRRYHQTSEITEKLSMEPHVTALTKQRKKILWNLPVMALAK